MNKRRLGATRKAQKGVKVQKGAVALTVAAMLPVLMGVAALAIDLSHVQVVRSEMQNDADAAALAGANALLNAASNSLQWDVAAARAQSAVGLNSAAGHTLTDAVVTTGFWNFKDTAAGVRTPPIALTAWDVPAVSVTLRKQVGENDGPVQTFFARVWKVLGINQQVSAVAVLSSPGQMSSPFPMVLPQCLYDKYWDSSVYPPRPRADSPIDREFMIYTDRPLDACGEWSWTTLLSVDNDTGAMLRLISNAISVDANQGGDTPSLSIGQDIWIQPKATKTPVIRAVQQCSVRSGDGRCAYVLVPVVKQAEQHSYQQISGFACVQILDAYTLGSNSTMTLKFDNRCDAPQAGGAGPNYGVVTPSSLVR